MFHPPSGERINLNPTSATCSNVAIDPRCVQCCGGDHPIRYVMDPRWSIFPPHPGRTGCQCFSGAMDLRASCCLWHSPLVGGALEDSWEAPDFPHWCRYRCGVPLCCMAPKSASDVARGAHVLVPRFWSRNFALIALISGRGSWPRDRDWAAFTNRRRVGPLLFGWMSRKSPRAGSFFSIPAGRSGPPFAWRIPESRRTSRGRIDCSARPSRPSACSSVLLIIESELSASEQRVLRVLRLGPGLFAFAKWSAQPESDDAAGLFGPGISAARTYSLFCLVRVRTTTFVLPFT